MPDEMSAAPPATPVTTSTGRRFKESDTPDSPLDASMNSWQASAGLDYKPSTESQRELSPSVAASLSSAMNLEMGKVLDLPTGITGSRRALSTDQQARGARILAESRQPPPFTGERPAAWIAQLELFMDGLGFPEEDKLQVALTFLDTRQPDGIRSLFRNRIDQQT